METFLNSEGAIIVHDILDTIEQNATYLSEIDGLIGDGDHGINMKKGMILCRRELEGKDVDLSTALNTLGTVLMVDIGGSMGPLYGLFFKKMALHCKETAVIDGTTFEEMLRGGLSAILDIGGARVGDKTLVDTLVPAIDAFSDTISSQKNFTAALEAMTEGAIRGRDSTKEMIAKLGRASRLGERSRGVLDAGATSCCLILLSIAESVTKLLQKNVQT